MRTKKNKVHLSNTDKLFMATVGPHFQSVSNNDSFTEAVVSSAIGEYLTEGSLLHYTPPEYACPTGTSGQDKLGYMQKCPLIGPAQTSLESHFARFGPAIEGERSDLPAEAANVHAAFSGEFGRAAGKGTPALLGGSRVCMSAWK